ncbi:MULTISPECIES: tyrosine--tRNA ligase [Lysinibacillus]|uniref:tyrosine--tRNA ligase n=1 Tax=Lysinibacillus TaxID=400634 RepID=UPI001C8BC393|nr:MULTISPECIES: tyrosine--tRNA ligase [Lysinibacillus]MBX8943370.1 tyrosine--tRNA ligase [Lysinibacillus sp. K60]UNT57177.1 tyrosine--tRNA ligase [Lysinibacillus capsici]UUV22960.1 tyrosine--tRNA ligase [Lysinibacillus sp. FN11]UYB45823.1 tyrosine--tRNA ligase [Lysinibacillus capsici]WDU78026.1 tyrosine--tRNA ligase [Lysinibacillus sp. G01H]
MFLTPKEQMAIIKKGANKIVDEQDLLEKLERSYKEQRPLTIKLGLDPSAPDIHLGHAVVLRKIKQMQDLGHHAVIVIGDFTGRIGDPTGKAKGRTALNDDTVKKNAQTYCEQIFKVLDPNKTTVRFNSEWLAKLSFEEVIKLAATTSVARLLEREDFQKRYQQHIPIGIHEFFYPLMQAYDSVELVADIELGGTDQTFNILMGRTLQKHRGLEKQIAIFMPLLEGLDGIEKMSKSLGNYIGINEAPEIMFKKVMEVPDTLIIKYFELATDEHPLHVQAIQDRLQKGENPRDLKFLLAEIITALYHGSTAMEEARAYFEAAFQKREIPKNIPILLLEIDKERIVDIIPQLVVMGFIQSKSEFLRLIKQKGVSLNGEKMAMDDLSQVLMNNDVLQIGKKRFLQFNK